MTTDKIKQTITRMATVSFQIKAWNIGLVTAVLVNGLSCLPVK